MPDAYSLILIIGLLLVKVCIGENCAHLSSVIIYYLWDSEIILLLSGLIIIISHVKMLCSC